jgi:hypothetical protein
VSSQSLPILPGLITIAVQNSDKKTSILVPTDVTAARIWLAEGDLPFSFIASGTGEPSLVEPSINDITDISWGFIEFTYSKDAGLWVDISNVDFVGIPVGLSVTSSDGESSAPSLQLAGLRQGAVAGICDGLANQSTIDGYPWRDLCISDVEGNPLTVLSPTSYIQHHPTAFADYWACYVNDVWWKYSNEILTINTHSNEMRNISCAVDDESLLCFMNADGDLSGQVSVNITKPSSQDIFSCNTGPFALSARVDDLLEQIVPRLCAAFHRSTLLLDDGNQQPDGPPSSAYYTASYATNWYSKLVHQWEVDGQGYAFPYDDVTSDDDVNGGKSQSGLLFSRTPGALTLFVGGNSYG